MSRNRHFGHWVSVLTCLWFTLIIPGWSQDRGFSNERARLHGTRDRTYDIQHLKLDVTFDQQEGTVSGTATTALTPINDGLDQVVLDAVDLTITSVSSAVNVDIEDSEHLGKRQLAYTVENGQLIIELDKTYSSGETITLEVTY
ncbi:MAG: hypothetical protein JSW54_10915, partial [Fidelibacterota bacterium]